MCCPSDEITEAISYCACCVSFFLTSVFAHRKCSITKEKSLSIVIVIDKVATQHKREPHYDGVEVFSCV